MHKPHTTPIEKEYKLGENDFIVSKTDLKSRILYGNRIFIELSGWEEEELLGKPHNILRHPDMPRVAFKSLYDHLKEGKEWFGYVKNLRKDGGYYWVFATITTTFKNNTPVEYYSVRRKPRDGFRNIIEPLYQKLLELEKTGGMQASEEYVKQLLDKYKMSFNEVMFKIQKGEINEL